MVNAIKLAARFIDRLPHDRLSPETTDGREGFVHPYVMQAAVDRTSVKLHRPRLRHRGLAREGGVAARARARRSWPRCPAPRWTSQVEEQYRNMREVLDQHPQVVERAREAIRAGRARRCASGAIRGGTDGSRLSFMGLPTPNLFAGEQNFHSRLEWVSVQDMEKAVEVIVELAKVWEERA